MQTRDVWEISPKLLGGTDPCRQEQKAPSRVRATITHPGWRQNGSAQKQHPPNAPFPICMANSISEERCKMQHAFPHQPHLCCWAGTQTPPVTPPACPAISIIPRGGIGPPSVLLVTKSYKNFLPAEKFLKKIRVVQRKHKTVLSEKAVSCLPGILIFKQHKYFKISTEK